MLRTEGVVDAIKGAGGVKGGEAEREEGRPGRGWCGRRRAVQGGFRGSGTGPIDRWEIRVRPLFAFVFSPMGERYDYHKNAPPMGAEILAVR